MSDQHRPANILILDDEKPVRLVVTRILEKLGHSVLGAETLEGARVILGERPIELVLCDIGLKDESGLVLLEALAPKSPEIAVVMMTGNDDTQTAIDCLRSGSFDYLLKPMTVDKTVEIVSRVLDRQRKMKAEAERIEEQLRVLGRFSSENPNPVLQVAADGEVLYANAASTGILGELKLGVGDKLPDFLRKLTTQAHSRECPADFELENSGRHYSLTVTPIRDANFVYLYGHDISNLKSVERELTRLKDKAQKLALYDGLTGLANRSLLEDRFKVEVANCKRSRKKLAVAFIDLDRFKQINDTEGHKVGDQLLLAVATRLQECVRKTDTVARWGGDEFILLLPGIMDLEDARAVCEKIKARVQSRIAEKDGFFITMSMGASIYPDDGTEQDELLQTADAALLMVKTKARNEVIVFGECPELGSFQEKNAIRTLLCDAVSQRRIQVHYQPLIDARTGSIVGAEALARWHEEKHGWISPAMFVPLAESMGLIEEMGRIVQRQALMFVSECHANGYRLPISLNISMRQLLQSDFAQELVGIAKQFGLLPRDITLELTESQALLGIHSESEQLKELSEAGFRLSIDDFGQGHSSLASLHEMPVDELKIDMKFVRNLHTEKGRRIVQTIEELSRILGLETVAEGVETKEQERTLQELGIARLQGYFYSRPLDGGRFREFLECSSRAVESRSGSGSGSLVLPN